MLLITGASGLVGGPAVRRLVADGCQIRALTSSEESSQRLKSAGVSETVVGDFRSDADVARAVDGVDTVVHIPPAVEPDEHEIGYRVVTAAERAGVQKFVFVSCFHCHPSDVPSHHNKLLVEDHLYKSNLNYVVLQPSMFFQNIEFFWPSLTDAGEVSWPWAADQKLALVDTYDLAHAISASVASDRLVGGTYELSSDDTLTVAEMMEYLSAAFGRPLVPRTVDIDSWTAGMQDSGAPDWTASAVLAMAKFFSEYGYRGGNSVVYQAVTGLAPTSYSDFAARFAQSKSGSSDTAGSEPDGQDRSRHVEELLPRA